MFSYSSIHFFKIVAINSRNWCPLNPQEAGAYFTLTCGPGGFNCKSFKIGHKPFYSEVNDNGKKKKKKKKNTR